MPTYVNEVRRNPSTGRVERTGRLERETYREREGGGYMREGVAPGNERPGDLQGRSLRRAQENQYARENTYATPAPEPYRTPSTAEIAAGSPAFLASSRRSPNEFIGANNERFVARASYNTPDTSSLPGFTGNATRAPTQGRDPNRFFMDRVAATARKESRVANVAANYVENRAKSPTFAAVMNASGRAADASASFAARGETRAREGANAFARGTGRAQSFLGRTGEGYFRLRQKYPEAYAVDAAAAPAGYLGGQLVGAGANVAVRGASAAFPRATAATLPLASGTGRVALYGAGAVGIYAAAKNPREFGATGLTTTAFFAGATKGYADTYGVRATGPVRYGRPRTPEIRRDAYGPGTLTIFSERPATQTYSVYGRPQTARGVSGVSGMLRQTESGAYAGELSSTTVLRTPRGVRTYQDSFGVAIRGRDLGAIRGSDQALFAAPTSSARRLPGESRAYLDDVYLERGRLARINAEGNVLASRPTKTVRSSFPYEQQTARVTETAAGDTGTLLFSRSAPRQFTEAGAVRADFARARRGYGGRSVELLREQGFLREPPRLQRSPNEPLNLRLDRRGSVLEAPREMPRILRETPSRAQPRTSGLQYLRGAEPAQATRSGLLFLPLGLGATRATRAESSTVFAASGTMFVTGAAPSTRQATGAIQTQYFATGQRTSQTQAQQLVQAPMFDTPRGTPGVFAPPPTPPAGLPGGAPFFPGASAAETPGRRGGGSRRSFQYAPSIVGIQSGQRTSRAPTAPILGFEVRLPVAPRRRR